MAVAWAIELAMAMSITQDRFDEVVKENMEDFGMGREGADEDAVEQFKAQGRKGWYDSICTSRRIAHSP